MGFFDRLFKRTKPPESVESGAPLAWSQAIAEAGLAEFDSQLALYRANSIFITTEPAESGSPLGASRVGGLPDLPSGTDWPEVDGKLLSFLAQFNLSEVKVHDQDNLLPSNGILFFFYDGEQSVWGFDPADKGHWRVLYYTGSAESLERSAAPPGLDEYAKFRECRVQFSIQPTLPSECPEVLLCEEEQYDNMLQKLGAFYTHHQLLGHESPVQGEVKLECQLVSNGLYCGDPSGYNDPRARELRHGAKDWILLFQVDSDDNPQMMWGDLGRLYFCIRKQDLIAQNFNDVWMLLQCS